MSHSANNAATFDNPSFARRAKRHLATDDAKMAHIIEHVGPFKPGTVANTFDALVRSVIHQQLSMKAARTIVGRVQKLCPRSRINPTALASVSDHTLRTAGLSRQKVAYVRSICDQFQNGHVKTKRLRGLPDDEVIERLVQIKGVGVWTAEMILIFNLQRPDIWPVDDLGLRSALCRWYRIPTTAKRDRLLKAGDRFRPYRSVATWYLWSSLGTGVVPGFN